MLCSSFLVCFISFWCRHAVKCLTFSFIINFVLNRFMMQEHISAWPKIALVNGTFLFQMKMACKYQIQMGMT